MCKFYDANMRMALTDTDSIYSVAESFRGDLMHTEVHTLKHSPIDYTKSLHAYTMATAYMKTFAPILDFSSLKPKVNTRKKTRPYTRAEVARIWVEAIKLKNRNMSEQQTDQ